MAAFLLLAPLLLLGTAAGQADTEMEGCLWLWNTTEGNFSVETTPETYQANTTYLVTIKDDRNHSNSSGQLLLQALSPQNASVGRWEDAATASCSSVLTAVLNISERESTARWTSPGSDLSSVHFRVFLSLPDNTTELRSRVLTRGAETTTVPPNSTSSAPSTSPSSGSRAQGSSRLLAALLLLLTGSLLC
ncbi:placenta-expressed transcript 1 protein-like [Passer montanus]|uniref:placenta-expressed transcript 1 protein-like n=1 Tax=Passer montanus TaxID=9160 RepID=UPI00195F8990|nr:placenta-expressed transcript 1 protein-like [Passer montanus]